jgi:uncharacterized RDD family membrane protein YckC
MTEPVRTPNASDRSLSDAEREARIEELLLSGLDHYFSGRYEQAINIWTRVAFLERRHGRARAYIERARSALAERQRESEELLHGGVAAYNAGDLAVARDLLSRAVEQGDPSDTALAFLQRLTRLEAAAAALDTDTGGASCVVGSRTDRTGEATHQLDPDRCRERGHRRDDFAPDTSVGVLAGRTADEYDGRRGAAPRAAAGCPVDRCRAGAGAIAAGERQAARRVARPRSDRSVGSAATRSRSHSGRAAASASGDHHHRSATSSATHRQHSMKCPKCDYLGFDTGERCRNCGYDFSLIAAAPVVAAGVATEPDLPLRRADAGSPEPVAWPEHLDRSLRSADDQGQPVPFSRPRRSEADLPTARSPRAGEPALPLFSRSSVDDDEPLIKMPGRATTSVVGAAYPGVCRATRRQGVPATPTLGFGEDVTQFPSEETLSRPAIQATPPVARTVPIASGEASGAVRRVVAACIDHLILGGIDVAVIYFTLRLVSLTWSDWQLLSPLPLFAFLALVKFAYFSAFTALGGQTIGKMATHIRVVSEQNRLVDPAHAVRRSLAGVLSLLTLGIGFLPALLTTERRALHDRLAHTRVVTA